MVEIKNLEEKQLQIGYFLSRCRNDKFAIHNIYRQWCQWWKEDFNINGTQPVIYGEELVLSKKGARLGEEQPDIIKYYNSILVDTQKLLESQYDNKKKRTYNSDCFKDKMFKLRRANYRNLMQLLKDKNLRDKYYIADKTLHKHPCRLGIYALYKCGTSSDKAKGIYFGTYDELKKDIENMSK
jgi:hypothetical protein